MNRIFTLCFFFILATNVFAQDKTNKFVVSTSVQFSKDNPLGAFEQENVNLNARTTITLIPRIAYQFHPNWAAGALYSYSNTSFESTFTIGDPDVIGKIEGDVTHHLGGLFVQRVLVDKAKFQLFTELDGRVGTQRTHYKSDLEEVKRDYFSSGLHLGGRYKFYKGLGAEFRVEHIIGYHSTKQENSSTKGSEWRVLSDPLGNVSIGLSYSF